jgi:hypothetical protein
VWRAARRGAAAAARHTRAARARAHRVPNLQLDVLVINLDHARAKFYANGQVVHLLEARVGKLQQQARLAHARVACGGRKDAD